ncbi:terpene synthase family protein [Kitasatospora sp. NPDC094011]|uniref:terpene synthase family protein n=1 Tax=Kitasatospora sp. NPDC094011 TaxID=3364090 RepID=UPI00380C4096
MPLISIPEFSNPFPVRASRHREAIRAANPQWLHRQGLVRGDAALQRYTAMLIEDWASETFAACEDRRTSLLLANWWSFIGLYDDIMDDGPLGWDHPSHLAFHAELTGVLNERNHTPHHGPQDRTASLSPLGAAFDDLLGRTLPLMLPALRTRFVTAVGDYITASVRETEHRSANSVPDSETYMALRRTSGGIGVCFRLLELSEGIALPQPFLDSWLCHDLHTALIDQMSLLNDVISLEKELAHGDTHNLVILIHREQGCSWQEAADTVARQANACTKDFQEYLLRLEADLLPGRPHSCDRAALVRYARGLQNMHTAHLKYSLHSGRFTDYEDTRPGAPRTSADSCSPRAIELPETD